MIKTLLIYKLGDEIIGKKVDRTWEREYNNQGLKMWILKYINSNNVIIQFEDGYVTKSKYINFTDGNVRNPYHKTVYGHGYIGDGLYKTVEKGKHTRAYKTWTSMLQRCYSEKSQERYPWYKDCKVCDDWLNFQHFANWYENNYYEVSGQRMELDKDILYRGNKIYSPYTCIFVPQEINLMFRGNSTLTMKQILATADKYKNEIPTKLYNALLEYIS